MINIDHSSQPSWLHDPFEKNPKNWLFVRSFQNKHEALGRRQVMARQTWVADKGHGATLYHILDGVCVVSSVWSILFSSVRSKSEFWSIRSGPHTINNPHNHSQILQDSFKNRLFKIFQNLLRHSVRVLKESGNLKRILQDLRMVRLGYRYHPPIPKCCQGNRVSIGRRNLPRWVPLDLHSDPTLCILQRTAPSAHRLLLNCVYIQNEDLWNKE